MPEQISSSGLPGNVGEPDSPSEAAHDLPLPPNLAPEMIRMVRGLAGRLHARIPQGCGIDIGDLIQAGNVGLLKAVRAFESDIGAPLMGYAKFRVRGEMLDLVRRHLGRDSSGGSPSPARVSGTGFAQEGCGGPELVAPADSSPSSPLFSRQRTEIIQEEVERLPARYRTVVRLRYSGELTLRQIGTALKVNESRACQLHTKAILHLRRALHSRGVSDFSQI